MLTMSNMWEHHASLWIQNEEMTKIVDNHALRCNWIVKWTIWGGKQRGLDLLLEVFFIFYYFIIKKTGAIGELEVSIAMIKICKVLANCGIVKLKAIIRRESLKPNRILIKIKFT